MSGKTTLIGNIIIHIQSKTTVLQRIYMKFDIESDQADLTLYDHFGHRVKTPTPGDNKFTNLEKDFLVYT